MHAQVLDVSWHITHRAHQVLVRQLSNRLTGLLRLQDRGWVEVICELWQAILGVIEDFFRKPACAFWLAVIDLFALTWVIMRIIFTLNFNFLNRVDIRISLEVDVWVLIIQTCDLYSTRYYCFWEPVALIVFNNLAKVSPVRIPLIVVSLMHVRIICFTCVDLWSFVAGESEDWALGRVVARAHQLGGMLTDSTTVVLIDSTVVARTLVPAFYKIRREVIVRLARVPVIVPNFTAICRAFRATSTNALILAIYRCHETLVNWVNLRHLLIDHLFCPHLLLVKVFRSPQIVRLSWWALRPHMNRNLF